MEPPIRIALSALALSFLLSTAGCGLSVTTPDFETTGTVAFVEVEGGCWVIDTSEGRLEPINLPERFKVDGLDVAIIASETSEAASICQVGTLVQIASIERVD